ncbi:hypothetical protein RJT34_18916 [Clitoria ternatea]|uniref:Uncharacterized protein n=1 Tax=Clitoria ternatea TaxID=43366 RepID=A0AAN9IQ25_CLITE
MEVSNSLLGLGGDLAGVQAEEDFDKSFNEASESSDSQVSKPIDATILPLCQLLLILSLRKVIYLFNRCKVLQKRKVSLSSFNVPVQPTKRLKIKLITDPITKPSVPKRKIRPLFDSGSKLVEKQRKLIWTFFDVEATEP